jgi:hypothetical protein
VGGAGGVHPALDGAADDDAAPLPVPYCREDGGVARHEAAGAGVRRLATGYGG